jgi:YidC/Oxa1 family membrane protein insertase
MAQMKVLAPKMEKLKQLYGDDKQKMNQAMMELYRTEKINPLGGCLPILVQIPVFIALYWVLLASIELRHAPWLAWIQDLSAPDPYFVLPVIYAISMFVQTKLNPQPADPVQAKVMLVMPIMFSVFFLFFPSGLVLYWVVQNLIGIAQQWYINRTLEREAKAKAKR